LNGERRVSEMSRAWCNAISSECVTVAVERYRHDGLPSSKAVTIIAWSSTALKMKTR
jgi:hypothetical protein